jgi:hypothetical protein
MKKLQITTFLPPKNTSNIDLDALNKAISKFQIFENQVLHIQSLSVTQLNGIVANSDVVILVLGESYEVKTREIYEAVRSVDPQKVMAIMPANEISDKDQRSLILKMHGESSMVLRNIGGSPASLESIIKDALQNLVISRFSCQGKDIIQNFIDCLFEFEPTQTYVREESVVRFTYRVGHEDVRISFSVSEIRKKFFESIEEVRNLLEDRRIKALTSAPSVLVLSSSTFKPIPMPRDLNLESAIRTLLSRKVHLTTEKLILVAQKIRRTYIAARQEHQWLEILSYEEVLEAFYEIDNQLL